MNIKKQLPARASVEQLKKQAKELLADARAGAAKSPIAFASCCPAPPSLPKSSASPMPSSSLRANTVSTLGRSSSIKSRPSISKSDYRVRRSGVAPMDGSSHTSGTLDRAPPSSRTPRRCRA